MVFDIFIPALNLVFEYHGIQHYQDHYMFGESKSYRARDNERDAACASFGITFIEIPYWWQRDKESIVTMLHKHRPDCMPFIKLSLNKKGLANYNSRA